MDGMGKKLSYLALVVTAIFAGMILKKCWLAKGSDLDLGSDLIVLESSLSSRWGNEGVVPSDEHADSIESMIQLLAVDLCFYLGHSEKEFTGRYSKQQVCAGIRERILELNDKLLRISGSERGYDRGKWKGELMTK